MNLTALTTVQREHREDDAADVVDYLFCPFQDDPVVGIGFPGFILSLWGLPLRMT